MRVLAILVALYFVAGLVAAALTGSEPVVGLGQYLAIVVVSLSFIPVGTIVLEYARTIGNDPRPWVVRCRWSWERARANGASNARLANLAVIALLVTLLLATFNGFKHMLPAIHPFSWDARLAEAGRILHGGRLPYTWLLPPLGGARTTQVVDRLYYEGWPLVLWAVFVWQVAADGRPRTQFLFTFAAAWIVLGTLIAIIMSSAGPVYYAHVVHGPDVYAPLLAHHAAVDATHPLIGRRIQDFLWRSERLGIASGGSGISAMPSMHVAMAELCAIAGRNSGRRLLAIGLTIFSIAILVGSVYLGPHYALDGYVSIVGIHVLWACAGRIYPRAEPKLVRCDT